MKEFLARHAHQIAGILSGFDRLVFRGTMRQIAFSQGLDAVLGVESVLLKEFKCWAEGLTGRIRRAIDAFIEDSGRPHQYLASSRISKELLVREILKSHPVESGLICVLSATEPCQSFQIVRDRESKHILLRSAQRRCKHYYWYIQHPRFGLLHVRLQTWLPFSVQICLNGREWLARQMDEAGLRYDRLDNCFPWIEEIERAQQLFDQQLRTNWPAMLDSLLASVHPLHGRLFQKAAVPYYWTTFQAEWATDVLFKDPDYLSQIYPLFTQHAMVCLKSRDVLRFLGKAHKGRFSSDVTSSYKRWHEGVRIKHSVNSNSVKAYDKTPTTLRVETTINQPRDLKAWRPKEGDSNGKPSWRVLRKGVADLYRQAQLSQAANDRLLDALAEANTDDPEPLQQTLQTITKPTKWKGRRVRALRPLHPQDGPLLEAIGDGAFTITGFRNRDLVRRLYGDRKFPPDHARRLSARVTRLLRLLRAHGLIKKVPHSHRYLITTRGRRLVTAITNARNVSLGRLQQAVMAA